MNFKQIILFITFISLLLYATDVVVKSDGTGANNNGISFQNSSATEIFVIEGDGEIQAGQGRIKDKSGYLSPVGSLIMYAGSSAPTGWLLCDGSAVSRSTYADLFSSIGTNYGAGDGSSTFALPDLRGRMPLGLDNMGGTSANIVTNAQADALNGKEGAETHTLTSSEMPAHTHTYSNLTGGSHSDAGSGSFTNYQSTNSQTSGSTGSGSAHNNMPPYIALNYIIKF